MTLRKYVPKYVLRVSWGTNRDYLFFFQRVNVRTSQTWICGVFLKRTNGTLKHEFISKKLVQHTTNKAINRDHLEDSVKMKNRDVNIDVKGFFQIWCLEFVTGTISYDRKLLKNVHFHINVSIFFRFFSTFSNRII